MEIIAQLYRKKGHIPKIFLGETALEECIKQVDNPPVLHLATHAFFLEDIQKQEKIRLMGVEMQRMAETPLLRSGLLFAGAARILKGKEPLEGLENGILTAREALDLNLDNTELVVLSACDTGLGEIRNGEGVYGLQRAFQVAGADAVLMSLWKVDDKAARDFMIAFYNKWLSSDRSVESFAGVSKRDAYDHAVAVMKSRYPAPFYWGAFVMVGE